MADPRLTPRPSRDAFMPTRPQKAGRIIGRHAELQRIIEAIEEEYAHVVLYAERGQGKTSLANCVAQVLTQRGYAVGRYACESDTTFDDIIRGQARELAPYLLASPIRDEPGLQGCESALPAHSLRPRDVVAFASRLNSERLIILIDEFDRLHDDLAKNALVDTIKQISDRAVSISFFFVGVSASLDELIGRNPSIQRSVVGLALPPMADTEIKQILQRGAAVAEVFIPAEIVDEVAALADGSPYIAHLVGLRLLQSARSRASKTIDPQDLETALNRISYETDLTSWPRQRAGLIRFVDESKSQTAPQPMLSHADQAAVELPAMPD